MPLCVDQTVFLKTWLKIPMRTGATVPSSKVLARLITGDIVSNGGPVIKLGPGTGAFKRSILANGLPEDKLRLVEKSPDFTALLRQRLSKAQLLELDVIRMRAALPVDLKKGFSEAVVELEKVSFNFDCDVAVEKAARDKIISQGSTFYPSLLVADQKAVGSIALGQRADLQELDTDHPALLGLPVDSLLDAYEFSEPGPQPCRNRLADPQVTTDLPPCAPIGSSCCQERAGRPPLFKS